MTSLYCLREIKLNFLSHNNFLFNLIHYRFKLISLNVQLEIRFWSLKTYDRIVFSTIHSFSLISIKKYYFIKNLLFGFEIWRTGRLWNMEMKQLLCIKRPLCLKSNWSYWKTGQLVVVNYDSLIFFWSSFFALLWIKFTMKVQRKKPYLFYME